jgi:hypothetical protein
MRTEKLKNPNILYNPIYMRGLLFWYMCSIGGARLLYVNLRLHLR